MKPIRSSQELFEIIDKSVRSAAKKAIIEHKKAGRSIIAIDNNEDSKQIKNKHDIINYLEEILLDIQKIDSENNVDPENYTDISMIRLEILSLLEEMVIFYVKENIFDIWVKDCLASALSSLRWNLGKDQPSTSMLRLCLVHIHKSFTDKSECSASYPNNKENVELMQQLNQDDFITEISRLRRYC